MIEKIAAGIILFSFAYVVWAVLRSRALIREVEPGYWRVDETDIEIRQGVIGGWYYIRNRGVPMGTRLSFREARAYALYLSSVEYD